MKLNKILSALALSGAFVAGSAHAIPSLVVPDLFVAGGVVDPFGGFDWTSGSAAWTSGFDPIAGTTFSLYYAGNAASITNTSGTNFFTPFLDTVADGLPAIAGAYEYTIFATFAEQVVSCVPGQCTFQVTGGSFQIFADTTPDARQANGTGYLDGALIIAGTFNASANNQLFNNLTGGQADLTGSVTYTNPLYINPALVKTTVASTLQLGTAVTNFTIPSGFDFNNDGTPEALGSPGTFTGLPVVVFQADANQTFSLVPEPGTLALLGVSLVGLAALRTRRAA